MKKNIYSLGDLAGISLPATAVISPISRRSTISQLALGCWTVSPGRGRLRARPSRGSISSTPPIAPCLVHYRTPSSISLVSPRYLATLTGYLSPSALSRGSPPALLGLIKRVAKTYRYYLTRAGKPSSLLPLTSLNTASFPHSPDAFRAQSDKIWLVGLMPPCRSWR